MRPSIASFIACLNIGWALPLFYANGVAWHFPWIASGIIISLICYFGTALLMERVEAASGVRNPFGKAVLSLGYYVAVIVALLLVTAMVKVVSRHHGAA